MSAEKMFKFSTLNKLNSAEDLKSRSEYNGVASQVHADIIIWSFRVGLFSNTRLNVPTLLDACFSKYYKTDWLIDWLGKSGCSNSFISNTGEIKSCSEFY